MFFAIILPFLSKSFRKDICWKLNPILKEQFSNMDVKINKVNIKRSIAFIFQTVMNSLFLFCQNFTSFLRVTSLFWSDVSIQVKVFNYIFYCILKEERSGVTCWNSENLYSHTWKGKSFQPGVTLNSCRRRQLSEKDIVRYFFI